MEGPGRAERSRALATGSLKVDVYAATELDPAEALVDAFHMPAILNVLRHGSAVGDQVVQQEPDRSIRS